MKNAHGRMFIEDIREHIIGASLLAAAALLLGSWFGITSPSLEKGALLSEERHVLEQRSAALQRFSRQQNYAAYEQGIATQLEQAESMLMNKIDAAKISQGLYRLADEKQLQITALNLPEESAVKRHKKLPVKIFPVQLSISGEYDGLVHFIRETENKYILHRLELEGNKDGSVRAELEIHIPCLV